VTHDRAQAARWLAQFEGAGLDGVAKPAADCRYDQLAVTTPYELARVFGA